MSNPLSGILKIPSETFIRLEIKTIIALRKALQMKFQIIHGIISFKHRSDKMIWKRKTLEINANCKTKITRLFIKT